MPIIKSRIKNFLNENEYNKEFSSSVIGSGQVNKLFILKKEKKSNILNVIAKKDSDKSSHSKSGFQEEKKTFENNSVNKRIETRERSVKNDKNILKKNVKNFETPITKEELPRKCSENKDSKKDIKDIGDFMAKKK